MVKKTRFMLPYVPRPPLFCPLFSPQDSPTRPINTAPRLRFERRLCNQRVFQAYPQHDFFVALKTDVFAAMKTSVLKERRDF
jgi:hypothetical protein